MPVKSLTTLFSMLLSAAILSACGGGGGGGSAAVDVSGIGGTGIGVGGTGIVSGKITGFGSVFVNGARYDTNMSEIIVDGEISSQSALAVGMIVKLEVETENGEFTGDAIKVVYDDEVQGPVTAAPVDVPGSGGSQQTLQVFDQTITIDEVDTIFDGTGFGNINANDVLEISGFRTSETSLRATYVRFIETLAVGSELELRGTISGYLPPAPQFMLAGMLITFDGNTDIDVPNNMLDNGLYVEVEGLYRDNPVVSIYAKEIEFEDEDFGEEVEDVSLQGVISGFIDISDFQIDGQPVDASMAQYIPANAANLVADGVEVEVEGDIVGGILIADELELRDGETELRSVVLSKDTNLGQFEVHYPPLAGSIVIKTGTQTLFKDEAGSMPEQNFSLELLGIGDFVKVKGFTSGGQVSAELVKRKDPDSAKLQGAVEDFNGDPHPDTSITILGIAYPIEDSAIYEEGGSNRVTFFSTLMPGDIVELEDDEPDGEVDEVELDD